MSADSPSQGFTSRKVGVAAYDGMHPRDGWSYNSLLAQQISFLVLLLDPYRPNCHHRGMTYGPGNTKEGNGIMMRHLTNAGAIVCAYHGWWIALIVLVATCALYGGFRAHGDVAHG